ncbi:MAG: DNA/RNA non-specific endonuclease [Bacteroidota bacterium]
MKRFLLLSFAVLSYVISIYGQSVIRYETPKSHFLDEKSLTKSATIISFSLKNKQAYWVAYSLTKGNTEGGFKRSNKFTPDPEIPKSSQGSNADYSKSGYDKGHIAPAADMGWSSKTMTESFYFSNMSPQNPSFNRGIWKKLEELVRDWAVKYGKIYITTGPILDSFIEYIGKGKIGVPAYFYKAILYYNPPKAPKAIAFIFKNDGSSLPLSHFVVSVDSLEKRTNIDFFYQLPDDVEAKIEAKSIFGDW